LKEKVVKAGAVRVVCVILLLCVTVVWGFGIIVTDVALKGGMGVFTMLAGRFALAAGILLIVRLFVKRTKYFHKFSKSDIVAGIVVGVVNFF
jgi:drug/metabolite transporter (DMT)-like permease